MLVVIERSVHERVALERRTRGLHEARQVGELDAALGGGSFGARAHGDEFGDVGLVDVQCVRRGVFAVDHMIRDDAAQAAQRHALGLA